MSWIISVLFLLCYSWITGWKFCDGFMYFLTLEESWIAFPGKLKCTNKCFVVIQKNFCALLREEHASLSKRSLFMAWTVFLKQREELRGCWVLRKSNLISSLNKTGIIVRCLLEAVSNSGLELVLLGYYEGCTFSVWTMATLHGKLLILCRILEKGWNLSLLFCSAWI